MPLLLHGMAISILQIWRKVVDKINVMTGLQWKSTFDTTVITSLTREVIVIYLEIWKALWNPFINYIIIPFNQIPKQRSQQTMKTSHIFPWACASTLFWRSISSNFYNEQGNFFVVLVKVESSLLFTPVAR